MMLKCPIILSPFLETDSLVASVNDEWIPWKKMQIPKNYLEAEVFDALKNNILYTYVSMYLLFHSLDAMMRSPSFVISSQIQGASFTNRDWLTKPTSGLRQEKVITSA